MAVTAPEGRASVMSGSLFRLGTRNYKANLSVRNTKFLIYGKGEGDLVPLWTLFLRILEAILGQTFFVTRKRPVFEEAIKKAGVIP